LDENAILGFEGVAESNERVKAGALFLGCFEKVLA